MEVTKEMNPAQSRNCPHDHQKMFFAEVLHKISQADWDKPISVSAPMPPRTIICDDCNEVLLDETAEP